MFITFITFAAGWLSILGIPPFSGFWSKDEIIHAAFEQSMVTGWLLIIAAGITGFYMTRMFIMTFLGKARWEDDVHPHESPKVMTIPLIILALGSVFLGMALLFWGEHRDLARAGRRVRDGRVAAADLGDDRAQPAGRGHRRARRVPHVRAPSGAGRGSARLVAHARCA